MKQTDIEYLTSKFNEWNKVINVYCQSAQPSDDIMIQLHDIFIEILLYFVSSGTFKDQWEYTNYPLNFMPFASVTSQKMNLKIDIGLYKGEFYMSSSINAAPYLRSMDDTFWKEIIDLSLLGIFEFTDNAIPQRQKGTESDKLMKYNNSQIFKLIRNYLFLEITNSGSVDLGSLEIRWPIGTPWVTILEKGRTAFQKIYRINYALYRADYLANRGRKY